MKFAAAYYLIVTLCLDPACTNQQVARPEDNSGAMSLTRCLDVIEVLQEGKDGRPPLKNVPGVTLSCEPAE